MNEDDSLPELAELGETIDPKMLIEKIHSLARRACIGGGASL